MHIIKPNFFKNFIPDFFPKLFVNYFIGFIEFFLGVGLFFDKYIEFSAISIIILLILLLPIHIWDVTKKRPAIGSKKIAIVRIPFQFLLIYGIYFIYINS
ncbi:MAG: hypothetical protein ACKVIG_02740 [Flavobacteriales bacterium]